MDGQMPYLYLSILYHGLVCPFTAQSAVLFKVFTMGLHVKLMLYLSFYCNLPYKCNSYQPIKKSRRLHHRSEKS